jgi:hypothetical protein
MNKRMFKQFLLILVFPLIFSLSGCNQSGDATSGSSGVSIGDSELNPDSELGAISISWIPPLENSDGTALVDLAGYRVYLGLESGSYSSVIDIDSIGITSYVIDNLQPGTYYISVTAYDSEGNESVYSNELSKLV